MSNALVVENIKKTYGKGDTKVDALKGVSFTMNKGEFVGIMGASGSGKTTLLNIISTIDSQSSGKVLIDGKEVNKLSDEKMCDFRREHLGFVFQDSNLLDTLTIRENIILPLSLSNTKAKTMNNEAEKLANLLGIHETLDKYPYEVSGGQKQRAAVCRAMITNPSLILADEPTGALDSKAARVLLETFKKVNEEMKATLMMVTHDPFSASYCNRIIFIKDGVIFSELRKGGSREEFHKKILDTLSLVGGV
ncbi:ABC transporter ATP-binding protein [Clostridium sp. MSJ-11]|uniref:ABC transporter ATP-binding protein n=1 Tax=Clostridium mobile TaxID=2841512 RepID=A0ABS6EGZ6_9CLOT|nr:ABC transporter ATP-binding protein [Clostridium mobile]MBU5484487.1 ABC transporter ATP-binding protein [Clostridium mobile]